MALSIKGACENYFNGIKELANFRTNDTKTNLLAGAKCLSMLTGVIPTALAVVYAISALVGRVHAKLYLTPLDVNVHEVFKRYKAAALAGDASAQYSLAWSYQRGQGVSQNDVKALHWYSKAAENGDAKAQYKKGTFLNRGTGCLENRVEAFDLFKKSAEQGYAKAQRWVGWMYEKGSVVSKDLNESHIWYKKAAVQGDIVAINNLGTQYQDGVGTPKDIKAAIEQYKKGAEKGNGASASNLALLYASSEEADKDNLTVQWTKKAADLGHLGAQRRLGDLYIQGKGVAKDEAEGFRLIKEAAYRKHVDAQNRLGELYENGIGTAKGLLSAEDWYKRAADAGSARGKSNYERLTAPAPQPEPEVPAKKSWFNFGGN